MHYSASPETSVAQSAGSVVVESQRFRRQRPTPTGDCRKPIRIRTTLLSLNRSLVTVANQIEWLAEYYYARLARTVFQISAAWLVMIWRVAAVSRAVRAVSMAS